MLLRLRHIVASVSARDPTAALLARGVRLTGAVDGLKDVGQPPCRSIATFLRLRFFFLRRLCPAGAVVDAALLDVVLDPESVSVVQLLLSEGVRL